MSISTDATATSGSSATDHPNNIFNRRFTIDTLQLAFDIYGVILDEKQIIKNEYVYKKI